MLTAKAFLPGCTSRLRRSDAAAIVLRRHAIRLCECPPHAFVISEAGSARDDLDRIARGFEQAPGRFQADLLDGPRWAFSGFAQIDASEVAWAHRCCVRERRNGQVCLEMGSNPIVKVVEAAARVAHLLTQFGAEL